MHALRLGRRGLPVPADDRRAGALHGRGEPGARADPARAGGATPRGLHDRRAAGEARRHRETDRERPRDSARPRRKLERYAAAAADVDADAADDDAAGDHNRADDDGRNDDHDADDDDQPHDDRSLNRRTAVLLTGVVLAAGCGGGGNAQGILRQTANRLSQIRSGTLDFRLLVVPRGRSAHGKIGFALHGPFAVRAQGSLPVLDITYTQLAGNERATGELVSNGTSAYAESNGRRVTLNAAQLAELRSATAQIQSRGGLGQFSIDDWIKHPSVSDGGEVGGARTDHVSADLDVVAAANDLLGLGRGLGSPAPQLRGRNAKQLTDAVRHSS